MPMLQKTVTALAAASLALGAAACGEDRSGDVQFEGETETSTTTTGGSTGTETTGTETTESTETTETTTTP
jgi:hypothetical protein